MVETFVWIELDRLKQKQATRQQTLTLLAVGTVTTVSKKANQQQRVTATLSAAKLSRLHHEQL